MEKDYEMSSPGMRTFYFGSIAVYRNYVTFGQVQRALAEQMEDAGYRKILASIYISSGPRQ